MQGIISASLKGVADVVVVHEKYDSAFGKTYIFIDKLRLFIHIFTLVFYLSNFMAINFTITGPHLLRTTAIGKFKTPGSFSHHNRTTSKGEIQTALLSCQEIFRLFLQIAGQIICIFGI